jgi:hypothetical protein
MSRTEHSQLSGSKIRVRCGQTEILGSLHARHPRTKYISFFVDEVRRLYVLTDKEVQALSRDCSTVFDLAVNGIAANIARGGSPAPPGDVQAIGKAV